MVAFKGSVYTASQIDVTNGNKVVIENFGAVLQ